MIEREPLTQQGGQETSNLLHFGMLIVDLVCGHARQRTLDEIIGSSHYCATTNRWRRWLARPTGWACTWRHSSGIPTTFFYRIFDDRVKIPHIRHTSRQVWER
jgi:hypothetical protein